MAIAALAATVVVESGTRGELAFSAVAISSALIAAAAEAVTHRRDHLLFEESELIWRGRLNKWVRTPYAELDWARIEAANYRRIRTTSGRRIAIPWGLTRADRRALVEKLKTVRTAP